MNCGGRTEKVNLGGTGAVGFTPVLSTRDAIPATCIDHAPGEGSSSQVIPSPSVASKIGATSMFD